MPSSDLHRMHSNGHGAAARLAQQPLLASLSPAARADAVGSASIEHLGGGAWILAEGQPARMLTFLLDGEADVIEGGRMVGIVEGPRPLEVAATLRGRAIGAGYRADRKVTVARVPAAILDGSPAVADALAAEVDELRAARNAAAVAGDDFFAQPGAVLVPGPYRFGPFGVHYIVAETEPRALAALLPPGLRALPGGRGRYLIAVTSIENARVEHGGGGRRYRYHETTPFIPCVGSRGSGLFTPELYPDSVMAILLGREIYGFPKRLGRAFPRPDGTDLVVDDRRLLRARWSEPRSISVAELGERMNPQLVPGLFELPGAARLQRRLIQAMASRADLPAALRTASVFVRKRIMHEASQVEPRFRVDELIEVPFVVESMSDATEWAAHDVRFADGQTILTGCAISVFSARLAFRFAAGVRRRDYLNGGATSWMGLGA